MAEPVAQPLESDDHLADDAREAAALRQEIGKGIADVAPKAAVEEKPAPELKIEPDPEGEEDAIEVENKGKFVRHGAMHQERMRRKAAEEQAREWQARYASDMAKAQERLAVIAQSRAEPKQSETPIPDKNVDPIAYYDHQLAEHKKQLDDERKWREGQQQQQTQQQNLSAVQAEVARLESVFKQSTPDYDDAYAHLQEQWRAEAKAIGFNPEEAVAARTLETIQIAARFNRNPAEVAYQRAKASGWTGKKEAPPSVDLEVIAKGQAASRSPSAASGRAPEGNLSLQSIIDMDEETFADQFGSPEYRRKRAKALGLN